MNDKYRWHDLTKDPNDLPEDNRSVLVCYENRKARMQVFEVNWRMKIGINGRYEWSGEEDYDADRWKVVAWCDIHPFVREDDETAN